MTKKNKIVIAVLSVLLVVSIAVMAISFNDTLTGKLLGKLDAQSGESFSALAPAQFISDYPLVTTQQKDIFYEAYPDGTIKFFRFADGTFTEIKDGIKTKDIKLTCTYQTVPVKLYYLSTDVGTVGYGLFTSEQTESVKHFSYIFVRMADCPKPYTKAARTDYVLLTDMDAEDAYRTDKTYSDMYSYDMKSGKTTLVISSRDRRLQNDATFDEEWNVFTDSSINGMEKYDYFATARYHDTRADEILYDIMSVDGSRQSRRANATKLDNSPSVTIRESEGSYFCFVMNEDSDGFNLVKDGKKDAPLAKFSGSFANYTVSGNWIFNNKTFELTNIISAEAIKLKAASINTVAGFCANESGTKFVVFGSGDEGTSMILYNTEDSDVRVITDTVYDNGISNFSFIDDSTVITSVGTVNYTFSF